MSGVGYVTQRELDEMRVEAKVFNQHVSPGTSLDTLREKLTESETYDPEAVKSGALKYDHGKPMMDLLLDFGPAIKGWAMVATMGAKKYTKGGWKKMEPEDGYNRTTAALLRHLVEESEDLHDEESDLLHACHILWNAAARLCFLVWMGNSLKRR